MTFKTPLFFLTLTTLILTNFAQGHVLDSHPLVKIGNNNPLKLSFQGINVPPNPGNDESRTTICSVDYNEGFLRGDLITNTKEFDRSFSGEVSSETRINENLFLYPSRGYAETKFELSLTGKAKQGTDFTFRLRAWKYDQKVFTVGDFKRALEDCTKNSNDKVKVHLAGPNDGLADPVEAD